MSCLLVIDDDIEFCEILVDFLKPEGFRVISVHDGGEGLRRVIEEGHAYDLIILELMLPGMDGFEVLKCVRSSRDTPVLMLTSNNEWTNKIAGLEMGADDYLTKPIIPRELLARIRAILRRAGERSGMKSSFRRPDRIVVGDIELDRGTRVVRQNGKQLHVTSVELDLLDMLLHEAGRVVSRERLAKRALGRALTPYDRSVDVHVSSLRRKLGHKLDGVERIITVRGAGYVYANHRHPGE
jgi:two-component system response regulator CpxR